MIVCGCRNCLRVHGYSRKTGGTGEKCVLSIRFVFASFVYNSITSGTRSNNRACINSQLNGGVSSLHRTTG